MEDKEIEQQFSGVKTKPVPKPTEIGTNISEKGIASEIATIGTVSKIDINEINSFSQIAQSRDKLYQALDTMGDDPTVAAMLETYAEDATEYNENGDIIWATSENANIGKYVNFLLQSIQANKHAYEWVYSLCKYGDLYLKTFRKSDLKDDEFFKDNENQDENKTLNEDININLNKDDDHLIHYVEKVANPATTFELNRFGKTVGYIKADVNTIAKNNNNIFVNTYNYQFTKDDINIYNGDGFVHALLADNSSRVPEEVSIFRNEDALKNDDGMKYTVNRGQSLLYNLFKIWRELSLLENSMLLNRITKSAIVRVVSVEIGDMPKEDVRGYLSGIKELMEQKSALDTGNNMTEYTNPGPIENNIYVPTHNGQGAITTSQVGGDVNVSQLADIDYFTNKYYGAARIPKQYMGFTDDGAGFNGGQSLSIISSRYAKMIKRIQNALIQAITDLINLFLIDKKMDSYVGKFVIRMQPPTTQEEIDRREATNNKMQIVSDVMNLLGDIQTPSIKLKILKTMLNNIVADDDITDLIEEEIKKLEQEEDVGNVGGTPNGASGEMSRPESSSRVSGGFDLDTALDLGTENSTSSAEETEISSEETLPTPEEAGGSEIDFTNNDQEF